MLSQKIIKTDSPVTSTSSKLGSDQNVNDNEWEKSK